MRPQQVAVCALLAAPFRHKHGVEDWPSSCTCAVHNSSRSVQDKAVNGLFSDGSDSEDGDANGMFESDTSDEGGARGAFESDDSDDGKPSGSSDGGAADEELTKFERRAQRGDQAEARTRALADAEAEDMLAQRFDDVRACSRAVINSMLGMLREAADGELPNFGQQVHRGDKAQVHACTRRRRGGAHACCSGYDLQACVAV